MDRLSEPFHLTSHWVEWFDADLVWASPSKTAMSLVEYVIFAPVFEELAFRGLLFAILRRKFRFLPAALISASIFAIAHGYGVGRVGDGSLVGAVPSDESLGRMVRRRSRLGLPLQDGHEFSRICDLCARV
ncbi:MAG: CAAX protease family protein [Nitrospira sp.]|nr:MAG: CAAX protease family protein [Nitrospira sp.]